MSIETSLNNEEKTTLLLLAQLPTIKFEGIVDLQLFYGRAAQDGDLLMYLLNRYHKQWFESDELSTLHSFSKNKGLFEFPRSTPGFPQNASSEEKMRILDAKAEEESERAKLAGQNATKEARKRIYVLERLGLLQISEIERKSILIGPSQKEEWVTITPEGQTICDRIVNGRLLIVRANREKRTSIFIACAFGRQDIELLYQSVFAPLCESVGYDPVRIDLTEPTATITDAILSSIQHAECIIADLTYARPSVYFEVGFSNGLGAPVVLTCRADHRRGTLETHRVHFDLEQYKISFWKQKREGSFTWSRGMHPRQRVNMITKP